MKILKMILLTILISFLALTLFVFFVFKFVLTPERINNYLESRVEKTVERNFAKSGININELYNANYKHTGNELDDLKMLERILNIKQLANTKFFNNIEDLNYLSSQLFSNFNMRMELLKYRLNEYISNKNIKEE